MSSEMLPLFPLGQPLFPGVILPLQIFEQRYIRLIKESLRADTGFGIVATAEPDTDDSESVVTYDVGLEVKVTDWRQQDNGLLGISVSGTRRFVIDAIEVEDDGLLVASINWMAVESEEVDAGYSDLDELEGLLRQLILHPAFDWVELPEEISPEEISWKLAQLLPIGLDDKVQLLSFTSTNDRLNRIYDLITDLSSE